jgi:hypothetical protein
MNSTIIVSATAIIALRTIAAHFLLSPPIGGEEILVRTSWSLMVLLERPDADLTLD